MASKTDELAHGVRSTLEDFHFAERIGSGSFGVVWRAVRKQDGVSYAIKEIDLQGLSKKVGQRRPRPLWSLRQPHAARAKQGGFRGAARCRPGA